MKTAEEQFIHSISCDMTVIGVIGFVAGVLACVLVQAVVL